jgi:hypothetical protein
MVQPFIEIVAEYKERMRAIMPFLDDGIYDRRFMREDVAPNKEFLTFPFCNNYLAIQLLKDVGLLRRKVQCKKCDRDMTWCATGDNSPPDSLRVSVTRYVILGYNSDRLGCFRLFFLKKNLSPMPFTTVTSDRLGWFRLFFFKKTLSPMPFATVTSDRLGWIRLFFFKKPLSPMAFPTVTSERLGWFRLFFLKKNPIPNAILP